MPATMTAALARSYSYLSDTPIDAQMAVWNPAAPFSVSYSPPAGAYYIVLQVSFVDDLGQLQTDYAEILP